MRFPSGVTDQYMYFVAVDPTDFSTRETGLAATSPSFTVYRSRDGGAASAMTTPTINEVDATNMPGVYELLLDEDMTIGSGNDSEEMVFHITHPSMSPVTRTIELYRPKITAGQTLTVSSSVASSNVVAISGDSVAADNLESMFDGTGYTASTAPSSRSQVDGIGAASGGALNFEATTDNTAGAIKSVTFVGTQTGTFANTEAEDGVYHQVTHSGDAFDIVYQYNVGGARTAVEVVWRGYLSGSNDSMTIQAYDFAGASWDTLKTVAGQAGTTNIVEPIALLSKHTGTGADLGDVLIRFVTSAQTAPVLFTDQIIVSAVNIGQSVGYANGAIWIDTSLSNTNTEPFVDGVADNPVSTIAAANTLSASTNLKHFEIIADSSITLASAKNDFVISGFNYSIDLGGQSIAGSRISGASTGVTGTATATTQPFFYECSIGAATLPPSALQTCGLASTLTLGSAGDFFLVDCFSQVAGASAPVIDMGAAVGATNLSVRRWSGGITLNNLAAGDVVTLDGIFGTITLNGADAQVEIRGIAKAVVNNLSGSPTVNDDSIKQDDIAAILEDTGTSLPSTLSSAQSTLTSILNDTTTITGTDGALIDSVAQSSLVDDIWDEVLTGASHNVTNSAGRRIRALSDIITHEGTAQGSGTGTNQIQLAAAASAIDGAYDPGEITIISGTGAGQSRLIFEYDGTTKIATVDRDWKVNPSTDSGYVVTAVPGREHVNEGLAQGGSSTTITLNALASSVDDLYVGQMVFIRSGTGADQAGLVTAYNGTTKIATIDGGWAVTPDTTSAYAMLPISPVALSSTTQAQINALPSVTDILTTQMTESYAADGVAPTLAQSLMLIQQMLGDFSISGTTLTVRRLDGSTTAATFTLNDATSPTGTTRTT